MYFNERGDLNHENDRKRTSGSHKEAASLQTAQQFQLPHDAKDTRGKYLTRKTAGEKNVHPLPYLRHTQRRKLHRTFYMEIRSSFHQLLANLQGNTSRLSYTPILFAHILCALSIVLLQPMATQENA